MSSAGTILVLDLGTSRVKASLFTVEGRELAHHSADYPTYTPGTGHAEQHPADWWAAAARAVRCLWEAGEDRTAVQVISVTGQMHGVVPVDGSGAALGPCLTLRDRRAAEEAALVRERLGAETIYRISGARLDSSSLPAKALWYRRHSPLWESITAFLAPKDWLRGQLTGGEPLTDPVEAAGMVVYDLRSGAWSEVIAEACELPIARLPALRTPTDRAGTLTNDAAAALAMPPGCPVVVGAADDVEFIGAGLLHSGDCLEHLGSTGSLLLVVEQPVDDATGTLELYPHLIPGCWILGGSTSNGGAALGWLRGVLGASADLDLPAADPETSAAPPPIFLPYLAGERAPIWEPGLRAAFWGLSLEHGQPDLVRGAFEGVAFSLRHLLDCLIASGHQTPDEIRVAPASGTGWLALRAAAYQRPLRVVNTHDPTALGAALIGACALGVYPDLKSAAQATVQLSERIDSPPAPALAERYKRYLALSAFMRQFVREG